MRELQKELNRGVRYIRNLAKEIHFYVKKAKDTQVDLDKITTFNDLAKAYEKGFYITGKDLPLLITPYRVFRQWFLTSGTSSRRRGEPPSGKPIAMTIDDMKRNIRACKIGYESFIEKGDKILNCFPFSPGVSGEASIHGLKNFEVDVFHTGPETLGNVRRFLKWYSVFSPNVVFGLTSSLYQLPLKLREANIKPESLNLQKFMTAAQPSSIKERKIIGSDFGGASVYDWYASTESLGPMACEKKPFSDEYEIVLPEILLFVVKDGEILSEGERGNTLITNLYRPGEIPHMVLINYLFSEDEVTCKEITKEGYPTIIGEIENAVINLGGSKLTLREIKEIRAELEEEAYKGILSRKPPLTRNYRDEKTRKDVGIIRIESLKILEDPEKRKIADLIREKIYEMRYDVWKMVEEVGAADLIIEITNPGELFKGYEKYLTPGKPLELIKG